MQLSEQEIIRREKLSKLRELGINPYPANLFPVDHSSKQIKETFKEGKKVVAAGRLMSVRDQGKATFAEIEDQDGRIQLYLNRDVICPNDDKTLYNNIIKTLTDLCDFIAIECELFTPQVVAKCIRVEKFSILTKTLRPLPLPKTDAEGHVYDAFTDPELRYRMRYVDLIVNPLNKE